MHSSFTFSLSHGGFTIHRGYSLTTFVLLQIITNRCFLHNVTCMDGSFSFHSTQISSALPSHLPVETLVYLYKSVAPLSYSPVHNSGSPQRKEGVKNSDYNNLCVAGL